MDMKCFFYPIIQDELRDRIDNFIRFESYFPDKVSLIEVTTVRCVAIAGIYGKRGI